MPGTTMPDPNALNRLWMTETTNPSESTTTKWAVSGLTSTGAGGGVPRGVPRSRAWTASAVVVRRSWGAARAESTASARRAIVAGSRSRDGSYPIRPGSAIAASRTAIERRALSTQTWRSVAASACASPARTRSWIARPIRAVTPCEFGGASRTDHPPKGVDRGRSQLAETLARSSPSSHPPCRRIVDTIPSARRPSKIDRGSLASSRKLAARSAWTSRSPTRRRRPPGRKIAAMSSSRARSSSAWTSCRAMYGEMARPSSAASTAGAKRSISARDPHRAWTSSQPATTAGAVTAWTWRSATRRQPDPRSSSDDA